ncbi:unnamed protein product [Brugia timori]|uniref:7TM_GPCR_Srx domain-containing protein n=1 Tax=Brugia timori TaxID=42155 RepID=A0A0R3RD29_9BILA|nr:unnamed protein product [Brugia timori]
MFSGCLSIITIDDIIAINLFFIIFFITTAQWLVFPISFFSF